MGLFKKIFGNDNRISNNEHLPSSINKLKEIGVDLFSYNHEDLEPVEISLDDELKGVIKSSNKSISDGDTYWDYISLSDKKDGKRTLYLSKDNIGERGIKEFIDKLFIILGEDFVYKKEFDSYDLQELRKNNNTELRRWIDKTLGYSIVVGGNLKDQFIYLHIF